MAQITVLLVNLWNREGNKDVVDEIVAADHLYMVDSGNHILGVEIN